MLALGVHVGVIAVFSLLGGFEPPSKLAQTSLRPGGPDKPAPEDDDRPMQIETLVDELQRPDEKTPEEKRREEEAKKEEESKDAKGQVVDIAKPLIEERPDHANFLAEHDSKVDKETKGPSGRDQAGGAQAAVPPVGDPSAREARKAEAEVKDAGQRPGRPGPLAMRDLERRRHEAEDGPLPTKDGDAQRAGAPQPDPRLRPRAQESGEGGQAAERAHKGKTETTPGMPGDRRPNLVATPEMLERAIGKGAGSMDYLKDIDDGEATALNAKRWKHAPFFNRVKRAVANEWHPEVVYVRHDPSGNVYGVKDRVTVLRVHLKPDGKLASWTVLQSSGVEFLDDEAIDAFRRAAPFPNPPKDLVEADGQIHFNFAFIFELSGRGSLKVFKYQ